MVDYSRIAVIIPALNEAETVAGVVKEALTLGCAVYVVDDNSADATGRLAAGVGAIVLKLPYTAGAWMAVQAGLLYAKKTEKYDFFVTLDADGQHDPKYIIELLKVREEQGSNVLIGSYPKRGSWCRKLAWRLFTILTRLRIHDLTSGFRLYDQKAVEALLSHEAALLDYQDLGVLLLLRRNGIECCEVPIFMPDRMNGHSRIFDTWHQVGRYIGKTIIWIMADWISCNSKKSNDWKKYDVF